MGSAPQEGQRALLFYKVDTVLKTGMGLLREKAEAEAYGAKNGSGFYDYSGDKREQAIRARNRQYIALAKLLYFNQD